VDVKQTPILSWSTGDQAASHQVYFGTDENAVLNAAAGSPEDIGTKDLGSESYDPGQLDWDTTYYWRVDEVNDTNPDSPWTGAVWSLKTANSPVIDDFEYYNDLEPDDPESNNIFYTWLDGFGDPANGALVGYEFPPFTERIIVHGGKQSMPLYYDNSVTHSEAELTLDYPRDWTEGGVNTLTIWFYGDPDNAAETLYVALNGTAVVTHDNPDAAQIATWTEWIIDLQAFADQGVDLTNVNTIALGLGDKNNPQPGGTGTMYFDDIRLNRPQQVDPGTDGLVAYYQLDNDVLDGSGNGNDGIVDGDPIFVEGVVGMAMEFDGDDHVDTGNTDDLAVWTIACWAKSPAAPSGDPSSASGPVHREQNYQFNWSHQSDTYRGSVTVSAGGWHAASLGTLEADTWYHLAGTYDGEELKAYKDGVLITTNDAPSGPPAAETGTLKLGRHATAVQYFTGTVDEARIYSRVLSVDEIRYLAGN
jgi:hypothetical protein